MKDRQSKRLVRILTWTGFTLLGLIWVSSYVSIPWLDGIDGKIIFLLLGLGLLLSAPHSYFKAKNEEKRTENPVHFDPINRFIYATFIGVGLVLIVVSIFG